ncbi:molybdopterin converting factor, subunit 2 [Hyphomonas neptunium ATCC 15444]|uniref:Molybdopterin synthase catalytic subunit n=2 Tax=Hyphomonas TaxID=85 RepID=Q0C3A5_HYPNA|nr:MULTISPECIES: molybdenum cofactor biosynthesis protein MoaE [Hyphomonas]ABI78483.1 molybdopterin converting factor, subunit 2 [Hyphomonas neptunium ATCC 15444]KCZ95976.1 molybdopterin converting factor subunit 2 [Hyphomonas hirschiana VP5]
MIRLTDTPFDPGDELTRFTATAAGSGAIVSFTGLVRGQSKGGAVQSLFLQAYSPLTERGIAQAAEEARTRWALTGLSILHRTGKMAPEDAIVFVATAAPHRRSAFEAADFLMDYLKTQAVFWKKEVTEAGDQWIEPRPEDYTDAARWAGPQES